MGAGEFNRLDRAGDSMQGDLELDTVTGSTSVLLHFKDGSTTKAAVRRNGDDLEFWDTTSGAWVTLNSLSAGGLVSAFREELVGAVGVQVITTSTAYPNGTNSVAVLIDGIRVPPSAVTETDSTHLTIASSYYTMLGGEKILVEVVRGQAFGTSNPMVKITLNDTTESYLDDALDAGGSTNFLTTEVKNPLTDEYLLVKRHTGVAGEIPTWDVSGNPANAAAGASGIPLVGQGAATPAFGRADWELGIETKSVTADKGGLALWDASGNPSILQSVATGNVVTSKGIGLSPAYEPAAKVQYRPLALTQVNGTIYLKASTNELVIVDNLLFSHGKLDGLAWILETIAAGTYTLNDGEVFGFNTGDVTGTVAYAHMAIGSLTIPNGFYPLGWRDGNILYLLSGKKSSEGKILNVQHSDMKYIGRPHHVVDADLPVTTLYSLGTFTFEKRASIIIIDITMSCKDVYAGSGTVQMLLSRHDVSLNIPSNDIHWMCLTTPSAGFGAHTAGGGSSKNPALPYICGRWYSALVPAGIYLYLTAWDLAAGTYNLSAYSQHSTPRRTVFNITATSRGR